MKYLFTAFILWAGLVQIAMTQTNPKKITNTPSYSSNKEVYFMVNGKKNGPYVFSYKGQKYIEGAYINDLRAGNWTFYDVSGNVTVQGNYLEGKKQGEWFFYRDKVLVTRAFYRPDSGKSEFNGYYPAGQLAAKRTYDWNSKIGTTVRYDTAGQIIEKIESLDGATHGSLERYSPKGDTLLFMEMRDGNPYSLKKSEQSKLFNEYYLGSLKDGNGKLLINILDPKSEKFAPFLELNYRNGLLNGIYRQYYPSCKLYCIGSFTNGYLDGTFRFFTEEGINDISEKYQLSDSLMEDPDGKIVTNPPRLGRTNKKGSIMAVVPIECNEGDMMASCLGKGPDGFRDYIMRYLHYPENAQESGIQGRVLMQFDVGPTGELEKIAMVEGANELLNQEAYRVVKSSPPWEPAFRNFIPSTEHFTFPVVFILQ